MVKPAEFALTARISSTGMAVCNFGGFNLSVLHSVRRFCSSCPHTLLTNSALQSPFSHHLGGLRIRRPARFPFLYSCPACAKNTHIIAYTIYLTSAQYFPLSPNLASRPSSHCARTSDRATPVGPANLQALTSARSCRRDLPPVQVFCKLNT